MSLFHHVEVDAKRCDVQCLINDIPVFNVYHRRSVYRALPIHEYLVQGTNTLELRRLDASSAPATAPEQGRVPQVVGARARIAGYSLGAQLGEGGGQQVVQLDFDGTDTSILVTRASFDMPNWPFAWSWQSLPAVAWTEPAGRARVTLWLQQFTSRFRAGDVDAVAGALRIKMSEYCRAYDMDLAVEVKELGARMARRLADSAFVMTPLTEADLTLVPCAGGRLVDCLVRGEEPAIRWTDSNMGSKGAMWLKLGVAGQTLVVHR